MKALSEEMSISNLVQKQWDIGYTSFASAERLVELIRAASEDNVQPQAVLALCALGSKIQPHQELIGKAVDALGGTKNVKLEHLRLSVGLQYGGTALYLRESTPGVAIFLLISALKLWHLDDDVGNILHQMAIESNIISRWPASAQQFSGVVHTLSGNAGTILPAKHLHDVGSRILGSNMQESARRVLYEPIAKQTVAKILTFIFAGFQDLDVRSMSLSGAASAVWLVAVLTWMVPDDVQVFSGPVSVMGSQGAKLTIHLETIDESRQGWEFTEWRGETSLKDLIITQQYPKMQPHLPRLVTRQRLQSVYSLSDQTTTILGQIAGAVLCIFSERGFLCHRRAGPGSIAYNQGTSQELGTEHMSTRVGLLEVASDWYCEEYASIMKLYGWKIAELHDGQTEIYKNLQDWEPTYADSGYVSDRDQLISHLRKMMNDIYGRHTEASDVEELIGYVVDIAFHALVFVTLQASSNHKEMEFVAPAGKFKLEERTIGDLLRRRGMYAHHFRQVVLEMLLPYSGPLRGDELVLEENGLVVYPSIIANPVSTRKAALEQTMTFGTIRKGKEHYSIVRELQDRIPKELIDMGPLCPFEEGSFMGLIPKSVPNQVEFEVLSTVKATTLVVRNVISFKTDINSTHPEGSRKIWRGDETVAVRDDFSWFRAIENLATAVHLGSHDMMTRFGEENLAKRLASNNVFDLVRWIPPYSGHDVKENESSKRKLVSTTCHNQLLCIYQLSLPLLLPIILHEASLIKAVSVAERLSEEYIIIT